MSVRVRPVAPVSWAGSTIGGMPWTHNPVPKGPCRFEPDPAHHCYRKYVMPMYETTVRTPQGDVKDRVYAKDLTEARMLFEQRHGPRNVPYIPKVIPS